MKRTLSSSICIALATVTAFAQSAAPTPVFEVSDVHASPRGTKESGLYMHAGRVELHGVTMLHLIMAAYNVQEDRIFGGPNWLDTDRFEIVAKTSSPLNHETFRPMLQALLADRFHLEVRNEDKPEPIYVLLAGKKVQMKEHTEPGEPNCKRSNADGYLVAKCTGVSMASLAERLPGMAGNYFNHPVVDKTGLAAAYDFDLKWTGRGQIGLGDADHPSISLFDYMDKQLGIKVEPQTRPTASIVIAHVEENPTANAPDVTAKLPPPLTEFEVAEIRPSKPDAKEDVNIRNGRIEAIGLTLRELIGAAYNMDGDDTVVGGDKWLTTERFDVIAKAPPTTTDATLEAMLQTLLIQRFHLKVHPDQQPLEVYALTAPKGQAKLKTSTSQEHAGCVRTPKDAAFTYTCHNTTMAQLVEKMPDVQGMNGYLDHPVVDLTNLKGNYDFDITWSPPARFNRANALQPTAGGGAQAPVSGSTLFEAIDKQLGLKLAQQKYPMPVVVIDHVDRMPTEN